MLTACEIYRTYLRSLTASIRLFEHALGTQAVYVPPCTDMHANFFRQTETTDSIAELSAIP